MSVVLQRFLFIVHFGGIIGQKQFCNNSNSSSDTEPKPLLNIFKEPELKPLFQNEKYYDFFYGS